MNPAPLEITTIRTVLRYEPKTGLLFWKPRQIEMFLHGKYPARGMAIWNARYANTEALGLTDAYGYKVGALLGNRVRSHRVAFAHFHGRWPSDHIDHIDGDRQNNRIDNLREATAEQNLRNMSRHADGSSRFKGVSWNRSLSKWQASCCGKYIGLFGDEQEAARAYDDAASRDYGAFARLNFPQGEAA